MSKVGIVGSRGYSDIAYVRDIVRELAAQDSATIIVTGGARGVDAAAEDEARSAGLGCVVHHADWAGHRRAAGPIRNAHIVADSDRIIAFWDGKSRGTLDTIGKAVKAGVPALVMREDRTCFSPNSDQPGVTP